MGWHQLLSGQAGLSQNLVDWPQIIMDTSPEGMKAVLLVGGMGTRLRPVLTGTPKPLASVGQRPFLELLVAQLHHQGIRKMVFCTGYLADEIEKEFGDGSRRSVSIEYSREPSALGTAGAVKFAEPLLKDASTFLAMNGDSFIQVEIQRLIAFHCRCGGIASMAVVRSKNEKRYGTVQFAADGRVIGFTEKGGSALSGFVNAGMYVFDRRILDYIPAGPASLERDVFPRILDQGLFAAEQQGVFIDIGTPEDYARAQALCETLYEAVYNKDPSSLIQNS